MIGQWQVTYETVSLVILVILYFANLKNKNLFDVQGRMFSRMTGFAILACLFNLLAASVPIINNHLPMACYYIPQVMWFVCYPLSFYFMFRYMANLQYTNSDVNQLGFKIINIFILSFLIVHILLALSSYHTHLLFYYTEQHIYVRGPLNQADALLLIVNVLIFYIYFLATYNGMFNEKRQLLFIAPLIIVFISCIDLFTEDVMMSGFSSMIFILLSYLHFQSINIEADILTGTFNYKSGMKVVKYLFRIEDTFDVVGISINMNSTKKAGSFDTNMRLMVNLVNSLKKFAYHNMVFNFNYNSIYFVAKNRTDDLMYRISSILDFGFEIDGSFYNPSYITTLIECPKIACNAIELQELLQYTMDMDNKTNSVIICSPETKNNLYKEKRILLSIRESIKHPENITFCYQPVIDISDNTIPYIECLTRIKDVYLGTIISPLDFIDLAENNNLLEEYTVVILDHVCAMIARYEKDLGIKLPPIGLNFSNSFFSNPNMKNKLISTLQFYDISPSRIKIEFTENVEGSTEQYFRMITDLSRSGFSFYLDDFGMGYSNLEMISKLPLEAIKLDKSLIPEDQESPMNELLTHFAQINMKRGIKIISEGAENQDVVDVMHKMGITYFQGYFFFKPIEESHLLEKIKKFL